MSEEDTNKNIKTDTNTASTSSNTGKVNINSDTKVVLNHPTAKVELPASSVNNLAGALSSAAGAGAAIKAMQHMPGGPGAKALAGGATMLAVQAASYGMSKVFNHESKKSDSKDIKKNIFDDSLSNNDNNLTSLNETSAYNDFPLNLLPDINQLINAELIFLLVILNIYIVKFISKIDYNKYIFDNKLGIILKKIINRYIIM